MRNILNKMNEDLKIAIELLKVAKCPCCDGVCGWYVDIAPNYNTGDAEQIQVQCQWCDEKDELIKKYE